MSIKKYAQFIAEQQRRMEVAGLAEAKKGDHPFKTYPPEHNMHLETAEGDEHHVIQGIAHTQENADHVFHEINKAGAKIAKMSTREFEAINGDTPFHHTLRSRESLGAGDKPTKVHKSVEDYVKYHAPKDAAWVKEQQNG